MFACSCRPNATSVRLRTASRPTGSFFLPCSYEQWNYILSRGIAPKKEGNMKRHQRRLELGVERNASDTELSLALSPILTTGYYSESLSQSVSARVPLQQAGRTRCSTPPPRAAFCPRDEGVVIQAGMSFVLAPRTTTAVRSASAYSLAATAQRSVRQHFRPLPAHTMSNTTSSALTRSIREFLGRTDHIMNEWKMLGREEPGSGGLKRSRSSTRTVPLHSIRRSSLRSSSISSSERPFQSECFRRLRAPSFQSLADDKSSGDTDFGSCQDLNDYDEV